MPPHFPIQPNNPTVLIDLDDTLAQYDGYKGWREIGPPRKNAQKFLRLFKKYGWTVIIWTTRPEAGLIREWLTQHKFFQKNGQPAWDYINANPLTAKLEANPSKPLADLMIDNAAYPFCGHPVPLAKVARRLIQRKVLTGEGMAKTNKPRLPGSEERMKT